MTKGYASILQKKLREAETQLIQLLRLPPQTQLYAQQDIEQRLDFLNTLFAAERFSNPQNPHHLQHIRERLNLIESVFREWNCSCLESCLDDEDEVVDSESGNCFVEEVEEIIELSKDGEKKGLRVGVKLATAMAGGFLIGIGVMGFMMLQLCQSSPYNPTALHLIPT